MGSYSIDPSVTAGNVENFIGTLQMLLGVAGPLHIQGEHARGNFYTPLATTEGTLVASYSRGMRVDQGNPPDEARLHSERRQ